VALALYTVFEGFSKPLASLMVTLWAVSIPISGLNVLNKVAVLHILNGTKAPAGSDPQHINALLMLFLDMHRYGIILAQIFWGLGFFLWEFSFSNHAICPGLSGSC